MHLDMKMKRAMEMEMKMKLERRRKLAGSVDEQETGDDNRDWVETGVDMVGRLQSEGWE